MKRKVKLMNIAWTKWAFYEAMENGSRDAMADYFETLHHHYRNRGKRIKKLIEGVRGRKK